MLAKIIIQKKRKNKEKWMPKSYQTRAKIFILVILLFIVTRHDK